MEFSESRPIIIEERHSADGSFKLLWQLANAHTVESIYFTFQDQAFTCISSQVGCNVGCPFCATGQQRVLRNLTSAEIVTQVKDIEDRVRAVGGTWPLDQVALAGMGEPLLNFDAVIEAATLIRAHGLASVVSLSTSGIVPRMCGLAETADRAINKLFLSLHATTDSVRTRLVPTNRKYPISQVLAAARIYAKKTGTKVTATYLLFAGVNDTDGDLYRLLDLLDPALFVVQLSEWNPVQGVQQPLMPSPRLEYFQQTLERQGLEAFIQRSKGREIEGGCGQLRSRMVKETPGTSRTIPVNFIARRALL
jgi:23S rRNA (adenine2503-C2)-methyltransferase